VTGTRVAGTPQARTAFAPLLPAVTLRHREADQDPVETTTLNC
jgi:hypothetical protein